MRDKLRERDKQSIRAFLTANADCLTGRVLDYGSGQQPYRDIVAAAGGEYVPYDSTGFAGSCASIDLPVPEGFFDTVICTQVIQYVPFPQSMLDSIVGILKGRGSCLLMTGPTNWPVVEPQDLWRFTPAGAEVLLGRAGFSDIVVEPREVFAAERDDRWMLGWQAKAVA